MYVESRLTIFLVELNEIAFGMPTINVPDYNTVSDLRKKELESLHFQPRVQDARNGPGMFLKGEAYRRYSPRATSTETIRETKCA